MHYVSEDSILSNYDVILMQLKDEEHKLFCRSLSYFRFPFALHLNIYIVYITGGATSEPALDVY